jgi:hypothetical protein
MFFAVSAKAQSLSVGQSVIFWGAIDKSVSVSTEYKRIGIHYFHNFDDRLYEHETGVEVKKTSSFAISALPLKISHFHFGGIAFMNRFPIENATHFNFLIEARFPIDRITLSYRHISNGFGLLHEVNPGIDFISLSYSF